MDRARTVAGEPVSGRLGARREPGAFAPDAGSPETLGLMPAPPGARIGFEVAAEVRLEKAREAMDHFAARVARLEHEREAVRSTGTSDTAALDRAIATTRRRLAIAELAESAILVEMAGPAQPPPGPR